jgi:hypothetical protein
MKIAPITITKRNYKIPTTVTNIIAQITFCGLIKKSLIIDYFYN